jgi:peptidoglycan/xylan/chitin deacetylase (PgdA/CDA1 family)/SAM-dependent methyltransferase
VVERTQEREWRSALRGVRALLRYYPPWRHRGGARLPVGRVRFGSFRRLKPVDPDFGFGRGRPIDRYYIEGFLARHADDVRGRVLEVADDSYTWQFGGGRVTASDVLHLGEGNPSATIVGDLTSADHIPSNTFDCAIVTQTLHLIYDVRAAVETLHRVLKPGGVVLATFPGISQLEWGERWHWMLTTLSARRLFEEVFLAGSVSVEAHGNVLAATAFLHGLVAEELRSEELDYSDPDYEMLIAVRAKKAEVEINQSSQKERLLAVAQANTSLPTPAVVRRDAVRSHDRRALILLYHRITELGTDPWALNVSPRHFADHLEALHQHANPLRLQQLTQAILDGNLPPRSVAITFDDGYADNLYTAKALLERYGIPATVFLTTGFIGQDREFWWDELDRLLLQSGTLPETLSLSVNESTHRWQLDDAVHYSPHVSEKHRSWRAWEDAHNVRQSVYRSLYDLLQPLSTDERRKALDDILEWAGDSPSGRATHRSLSLQEVTDLARRDLIEIGAHSVTHPVLSAISTDLQRDEIRVSKITLEKLLDHPVTSFAYPHGMPDDYAADTVAMVRKAGFARACSAFEGVVKPSTDLFQLPRCNVENWSGQEFTERLLRWFDRDGR